VVVTDEVLDERLQVRETYGGRTVEEVLFEMDDVVVVTVMVGVELVLLLV
jgi:hypothetical protein